MSTYYDFENAGYDLQVTLGEEDARIRAEDPDGEGLDIHLLPGDALSLGKELVEKYGPKEQTQTFNVPDMRVKAKGENTDKALIFRGPDPEGEVAIILGVPRDCCYLYLKVERVLALAEALKEQFGAPGCKEI